MYFLYISQLAHARRCYTCFCLQRQKNVSMTRPRRLYSYIFLYYIGSTQVYMRVFLILQIYGYWDWTKISISDGNIII